MLTFEVPAPTPAAKYGDRIVAFVDYIQRRTFEFCASLMMFGIVILLITSPDSMTVNSFNYLIRVGLDHVTIPLLFSIAAAFRIAALAANGNWPVWGPRMRALGATIGAIIWSQMAYGLLLFSSANNRPLGVGFPVYLVLTLGELLSLRRAGRDARNSR